MATLFDSISRVDLAEAARERYLTYALSVISSRALPDVRDGLKPVQRRILYTMWHDLHLRAEGRFRKSAKVVGEVMGTYHPHGDQALYEALVRLTQPWVMRHPLVQGSGNFGSPDGDPAAAMRYTECKLAPIAAELQSEIGRDTVDFRDNYDASGSEPVVLPARFPVLLVNGSQGIAVGMATAIPPHNLQEVVKACILLIRNRRATVRQLLGELKGPDFPTGGTVLATPTELREVYEQGHGSIRVRGDYTLEPGSRGKRFLVFTSVPYGVNKGSLIEKIGELIAARKVPQLVDVRDESTTDVRIVCELRAKASPEAAAAFIYRHTPMRTTIPVNLTALVPGSAPGTTVPERLDLRELLDHFIQFRYTTVRRRLEHELGQLQERIHILEGFRKVFNALAEAVRIIRGSGGKPDASVKLQKRFKLDGVQAEAILETKLYRLAKLEIKKVLDELRARKKRAREIEAILASSRRLWTLVRRELEEVAKDHATPRRTRLGGEEEDEPEFDPEAYIVGEDVYVVATRDGWVKRQQKIKSAATIRTREGDQVLAIAPGDTREHVLFLSNKGKAYTARINDIPATTGHGEPIQRLFRFADGERIVGVMTLDPRFPFLVPERKASRDDPDPPYALAVSARGYGLRFPIDPYVEVSTRAGRRYARPAAGDEIISVTAVVQDEVCITASQAGRILLCPVDEIKVLAGPGKGVIVHKLSKGDRLVGAYVATEEADGVQIETNRGHREWIRPSKYRITGRAGKGFEYIKRGTIARMLFPEVEVPEFPD
jgi:DNA gyrase subunit A